MTPAQVRRCVAAVVFIGEGIAILFCPRYTLTSLRRRHPFLKYLLNGCLDWHWDT